MGPAVHVWIFGISLLFGSIQRSEAYVSTVTKSGVPLRWTGKVHLNFLGNPINTAGITPKSFFDTIVVGLQRWKIASFGSIGFDYWQGIDQKIYPTSSEFDGVSTLSFASHAKVRTRLSPNVLGLTQVWFDAESGEILEADIVLNDQDFHFTNDPSDTSGNGAKQPQYTDGKSNVYIQNVVTHELGHALGLSHSAGLQSTMLFVESPEQAHLGCDDQIAIHTLYPSSDAGERGSISGVVLSESGTPVFGAHVLAISGIRGTVLATALTDRNGQYNLGALEPGNYYLLAEPYYAGSQSLPSYYSGMNHTFCPSGLTFSRSFLTENHNGFILEKIPVRANTIQTPSDLIVQCDRSGGAAVKRLASSILAIPHFLIEGGPLGGTAFVDSFTSSNTNTYLLKGILGHVEIHSIAYSLYSPIQTTATLLRSDGTIVLTQNQEAFVGESGYINRDSILSVDDLPLDDYILKVTSMRLQPSEYPAGVISLDSTSFLIVDITMNAGKPTLEATLANNSRCRGPENFPPYFSPSDPPSQGMHPSSQGGPTSFCGTFKQENNKGSQMDLSRIIAWFLPWIFMGLWARIALILSYEDRNRIRLV